MLISKKRAQVRTKIINEFNEVFNSVDVLITPPTPSAAWKIGEKSEDPLKLYLADAYTIPASLAGLPGISVPAGFVEQMGETLPVWVQFLANTKTRTKTYYKLLIYLNKQLVMENKIQKVSKTNFNKLTK